MNNKIPNRIKRVLKNMKSKYKRIEFGKSNSESSASSALRWIRNNECMSGGILVHSEASLAYPEVSGYLVPTLLDYGEKKLAEKVVKWLLCIQQANGGFSGPDGVPYVFDTGQVLRGLLAAVDLVPGAREAAERAADYLLSQMADEGKNGFGNRYGGEIPESVHLYILPPLLQAADILNKEEYRQGVYNCLEYYKKCPDFLRISDLTHFLAYEIEALIDIGCPELVADILSKLSLSQERDGAVRGIGDANWVCSPGLSQLAICWYKVGNWESADKALVWLEHHQLKTGGFLGSYGRGASYFPKSEIAWVPKFFLDANLLRVKTFFHRNANIFPLDIKDNDGRVQALLNFVQPDFSIVEIGCGKGRFLKAALRQFPKLKCTGVDISRTLLSFVPSEIRTLEGALERIPLLSDSHDLVFSIEAIEHSANLEASVGEMIRVAKPGGHVVIIDKHEACWGRLECPPWEKWPEKSNLKKILGKGCDDVTVEQIAYDGKGADDGLMLIWSGRKRSALQPNKWTEVLITNETETQIINRVKQNAISAWGQEIILNTKPMDKILEIGSGTGEISLHLAKAGRIVTMLDKSQDNLNFAKSCADHLGISANYVLGDAFEPLAYNNDEFDCVWQSGLLEHFSTDERRGFLKECARISKGKVISLVPNASCLAYRIGKAQQEESGQWQYGLEVPLLSQKEDFYAVGLKVICEYSVGVEQGLKFLSPDDPLRQVLDKYKSLLSKSLDYNQGYLLMTIGIKP